MRVRRVEISHFRGIESLTWSIAADQHFVALIGPGDATKTTILTAIQRALSDSWNVVFYDTDFYNCDIARPICIRVAVAELPDELTAIDAAGLHLCGLTPDGVLRHDPGPDDAACVVVELSVGADLEPVWTFHRPGQTGEPVPVRASVRAKFRAFRIDDRIDTHLRWSRTSALGRLTEARHGTKQTLLDAQRAARTAVAESISPALKGLADDLRTHLRGSGGGRFDDLRPGLDTSLNNAQGNLALFDGEIPLANFGLGSRRLAGAATQQMAHGGRALLLVDELEHGLEPHRLFHLLSQLRDETAFAQVFTTTHSPSVLEHLDAGDLVAIRRTDGLVSATRLKTPLVMQSLLRRNPHAFLARHVIVCEGKTEYGITLELLDAWNREEANRGQPSSAALGVVAIDAGGNSKAVELVDELNQAGYQATLFIDSDVANINTQADALTERGITIARWPGTHNTEQAVCAALDIPGLTAVIALALRLRIDTEVEDGDDDTPVQDSLTAQLRNHLPAAVSDVVDVATWAAAGIDLATARGVVAAAAGAKSNPWFKKVGHARELTKLLRGRPEIAQVSHLATTWASLRSSIYPPSASPASPSPSAGTSDCCITGPVAAS